MSVIHPSIATARRRKDAILFLLRMMKTPVHLFLELARMRLHGVRKKLKEGRWHSSLSPSRGGESFRIPFSHSFVFRYQGPSLFFLPPFFHVWHFKLNPPKKRRRRRRGFFFRGCDRSCDANEDDDIEWNSGGWDGKRKDAEVAKWDEGEGSEEKKVGAWASSSSSRSPREFRSLCHMSSLDFCQSSVGVKEGKKKPTVKMGKREKKAHPSISECLFSIFGSRFHFPTLDWFQKPIAPMNGQSLFGQFFPLSLFSPLHTINESQQTTRGIRRGKADDDDDQVGGGEGDN